MAGKTDYLENKWLALLFNAANIANVLRTMPRLRLKRRWYLSLHTSDPTGTAMRRRRTRLQLYSATLGSGWPKVHLDGP